MDTEEIWKPTHVVVVLGFEYVRSTAMKNRLDAAARWLNDPTKAGAFDAPIIVTGGAIKTENTNAAGEKVNAGLEGQTEASFMTSELLARGVVDEPEGRFLHESQAKYTIQNGLFVDSLIHELRDSHGHQLCNVVLVTNKFHMQRSEVCLFVSPFFVRFLFVRHSINRLFDVR